MNREKVNEIFRDIGIKIPSDPESVLRDSLAIINKNPVVEYKIKSLLKDLKKKLSESGGNWDKIKDWVYQVFTPKGTQVITSSEQQNKAKFIPLDPKSDKVINDVFYVLLSNIQRDRKILSDYEKLLGSRLDRENVKLTKTAKEPAMYSKILFTLDSAANYLESRGFVKAAYVIDKIADVSLDFLYKRDNSPENRRKAEGLKAKIISYVEEKGKVTAHDIYTDLKCDDIPMYLALHDLVKEKKIQGDDPYSELKPSHKDYIYTI